LKALKYDFVAGDEAGVAAIYAVDMIGEPGFSAPVRPALAGNAFRLR
jgi:hypothetical protein